MIDVIGFGIIIPVLPFYADEFGASGLVLGMLFTSHAAMQALFAPLWGRLADRIGRRPVMLCTIAGTSGALLFLGLADTLAQLFAARILSGIFAANISVATAYIADVTDDDPAVSVYRYRGDIFPILVFSGHDGKMTEVGTGLVNGVNNRFSIIVVHKKITLT